MAKGKILSVEMPVRWISHDSDQFASNVSIISTSIKWAILPQLSTRNEIDEVIFSSPIRVGLHMYSDRNKRTYSDRNIISHLPCLSVFYIHNNVLEIHCLVISG